VSTNAVADNVSIRPPSLGMIAYDRLKTHILQLRLAPGSRLIVDELAAEFGVSRTPIRDALRLLMQDGLVTMTPTGVFYVRAVDPSIVQDIFEVRLPLECLAVRQAAPHLTRTDLLAVQELVQRARTAADQPQASQLFFESDDTFHEMIVARATNKMLQSILRQLGTQIQWLRRLTHRARAIDHTATCDEHLAIIAALLSGDADSAAECMAVHLRRAQERLSPATP
jgi:DNA-binding GntR family transcriptional regulator